jgi:rhodanese-related sulfurtransferase
MSHRSRALVLTAAVLVGACSPVVQTPRATQESDAPAERGDGARLVFRRSPGGTFEVSPHEVERFTTTGGARIVDIREPEELTDELGHIPGVEHVPFSSLANVAEGWNPDEPVILVCRTGRRSSRAVSQLEALGFKTVAAMTGGMLLWNELGLEISRDPRDVRAVRVESPPRKDVEVSVSAARGAPPLAIELDEVRWIRTSSLLSTGSESCVDGRDPHAVVGTPGGDAGELIVALATAESLGAPPLSRRALGALVDDWIDTFGRFYIHTDVHALERLRGAVRSDPRFGGRGIAPADATEMETLVRHPPPGLEGPLLELLVDSNHIGCGHLRAMLENPDEFRVRPGLAEDALRAVFRHLFRSPEEVEWVVLEGEHHEEAVVVVELEGEVHAYTRVPAIPPSVDGRQTFVFHPQVTAFLREQNASFLLERSPSLAHRVGRAEFESRMRSIADTQREATLRRLAEDLPVYEVRFQDRSR